MGNQRKLVANVYIAHSASRRSQHALHLARASAMKQGANNQGKSRMPTVSHPHVGNAKMHINKGRLANKASLLCKQGFFAVQTRLLCCANKASFGCKQGFFTMQRRLLFKTHKQGLKFDTKQTWKQCTPNAFQTNRPSKQNGSLSSNSRHENFMQEAYRHKQKRPVSPEGETSLESIYISNFTSLLPSLQWPNSCLRSP